jgi:multidrug efflux pump
MASSVAAPLERQFGRIAGVTEMTSSSSLGGTSITMQFELDRDINAAARDVQAAINAARGQLPTNLPNNPSYRKVNPADSPIMILTLTSTSYTRPKMYDAASSILLQRLAQVPGVGSIGLGGSPPAVRVDLNPTVLNHLGIGLEDVRTVLNAANANRPKGQISDAHRAWTITATDQLLTASAYRSLIISYQNGAPLRLGDVADVTDSVEDIRTYGLSDGQPAVTIVIYRQPGANMIATVDRIRSLIPQLDAQIPAEMTLRVMMDRTATIRASLHDVQWTLLLSVGLVVLVVFVFLRDLRATFIPSVAVPVSLIGTFGVMYLAGYSLNNLSLMALTIATGFVVDDAIVVIENITRYIEAGMSPRQASIRGAREIGFTVLAISLSLIAVFIPILLMGGIVGRLFREFAVTLSAAILVSLVVSLTATPMLCAVLLKSRHDQRRGRIYLISETVFEKILTLYATTLKLVLRHQPTMLLVTLSTIALTVYLYIIVPKGFFPQQDTGRVNGVLRADQDTSFQSMSRLVAKFAAITSQDPAVANLIASVGGLGAEANYARMFIVLKPRHERKISADDVIARIRSKTSTIPGASFLLQSSQDLRVGGRSSGAQYQYTLQGESLDELTDWNAKLLNAMRLIPGLVDLNSDQQTRGLQTRLTIDRDSASRRGISMAMIDDTLYDAFGQRPVSTIYQFLNQYRVVMQVKPEFSETPDSVRHIFVQGQNHAPIPLSTLSRQTSVNTALTANRSGQFPSVTISFNLSSGTSLGDVVPRIEHVARELGMPPSIRGRFQGTVQAFQDSLGNQPLLILAALVSVYIVLGILYESYIHPLTILSTLPSAGVGALLALLYCRVELNVMALIGILLLIGVVKKNAIMMIDFALDAERNHGMSPQEAIFRACILRFRPITMTTLTALLGGLPLALGTGEGFEFRRPLGITIVGGLIVSQMLTLYTTPVVYLSLDRFRRWCDSNSTTHQTSEPPLIP